MLVADAALGQEAVSVADHFHKALGLTGVVLTKLDGDARGGAALSIRKVTGRPIKFVGLGERIEDFETFHPDRMASRILGMGDIVSLVEKASEKIDREEAEKLKNKLQKNTFDFNDFLGQLRQMKKLGGVESILKMLPGGKQLSEATDVAPEQFKQMEAIICSMTMKERENADIIDFPRRKRIAKGSGTSLEQVGQLIKQFSMMKKMMKKTGLLGRLMSGGMDMGSLMGGMGGLGGMGGGMGMGGGIPSFSRGSNRTVSKKKNRKKHKKKR
jgi:signal recognition particle subunit SRP54